MARTPDPGDMSTPTITTGQAGADTGAPRGHVFSLTGAADAANTSKRTLLRRIDQLTEHGAHRGEDGNWSIPLSALLAAGFRVNAPRTGDDTTAAPVTAPPTRTPAPGTGADLDQLRTELSDLRGTVAELEKRAAVAEAEKRAAELLAAERLARVEDLRTAMRQLEQKPAGVVSGTSTRDRSEPVQTVAEPSKPYRMPMWRRILLGL